MKKMILCGWVLCSLAAGAQTGTRESSSLKQDGQISQKVSLMHSGDYEAWKNSRSNLFIADPVTRALMNQTNGADIKKDSEIAGVSKRAYGFAHGHISLRASGAATSGTFTGGGSVGTGTTLGSAGMHGAAIGVNGKNPYAGSGIWGTAVTGKGITIRDNPVRLK